MKRASNFLQTRGFTIVEVLVALVIISSAMIPLLGSFTGNIRATGEADARSRAASLLESRLTDLKLTSFESLERACFPSRVPADSDISKGGYEFRQSVEYTAGEDLTDPMAGPGTKSIDLSAVLEKGVRYSFELRAARFRPSYDYRGLGGEGSGYTGPSRVTGKRNFIICECRVRWKTRKGTEHAMDALFLKAPTS